MIAGVGSDDAFEKSRQDVDLVARCRDGSETAWADLIEKYKHLIYSIPVKLGFDPQDASEVFQDVCMTLIAELDNVREPRALAAWLITTASRSCYRLRRTQARLGSLGPAILETSIDTAQLPEAILRQLEQEEIVRNSVRSLEPPCRDLVRLLFFTDPPIPYEEAALQLGLAKGSIGATRMRCLAKLRRHLEERGLR